MGQRFFVSQGMLLLLANDLRISYFNCLYGRWQEIGYKGHNVVIYRNPLFSVDNSWLDKLYSATPDEDQAINTELIAVFQVIIYVEY